MKTALYKKSGDDFECRVFDEADVAKAMKDGWNDSPTEPKKRKAKADADKA